MNIVYSSSDAYADCTGVSIWSLYKNNRHIEELNVYVLDTDISQENHKKLAKVAEMFNRSITFINATEGFEKGAKELNLPLMRGSYNTYSRVLMNKWFSNLDRVFVIDSDTLICGDISPIWDVDLTGKLFGAVPEVAMYGKYNYLENQELLRSVPLYYNMGMCLINLKEWRERGVDALILKRMKEEHPVLKIADQSIINMFFNEFIVRLNLKFNYYTVVHGVKYKTISDVFFKKKIFDEEEYKEAADKPVIIHYFGHSFERPWFKHNAAYRKKDYYNIRAKTPWNGTELGKWRKPRNKILRVYDFLCYLLLVMGLRDICVKFRYICGQRIKGKLGINR